MSCNAGRTLLLAGLFAVALGPDAALAQRRARVFSVEVMPTEAMIVVGQQQVFVPVAYDRANNPVATATFTFTSSNPRVATVTAEGIATGVSPGTVTITARAGTGAAAKSAVAVLTVLAEQLLAAMQRGGRWDLYTFGPDSAPRFSAVTADATLELEPAWSPDLTRIAYVALERHGPGSLDLFVVNADGSEARRVTNDSATVGSPVFVRPAGDRIVFQSNKGGVTQLYVVNLDGSGRRQLTTGPNPNLQPDVSSDGSSLLFASLRQAAGGRRNFDIWQMNVDGTGERRLTSSPRAEDSPQFAPDGRSFYFLRDEGGSPPTKRLYRQSLTDTAAVAQAITPVGMHVRAYSVSADGNLIVLTVLEPAGRVGDVPRVVLFEPASGRMTPVLVGPGEQLTAPVFRPATPAPH